MIIIADLHIGKTNDSFFDSDGVASQTLDVRKRLKTILARAKLTKQHIVVAGDVFNRVNPTTQSIAELFLWLKDCKQAKVEVHLMAGNHDAGVNWSNMVMLEGADLPNVTVTVGPSFVGITEGQGIAAYTTEILLWPHITLTEREKAEQGHGSVSKWVAAMYPQAEFIITHGQISMDYENEIFFEAGDAMNIEPEEFPELKLMVLGHVHDHKSNGLTNPSSKQITRWVYPGSLTINNFGEVDDRKGWVEVILSSPGYVYDWYEFPEDVTPWVHVELDLTDKDELSLDERRISDLVSGAVIKITVLAKAHGVVDEAYIRKLFNKYGYVSRFETVVEGVVKTTGPQTRLSYKELLEKYLKGVDATKEQKALAFGLGSRIIERLNA